VVPRLNRKDSVISFFPLVIGSESEKFNGPIGVKKSITNPIELLISLPSSSP
tara:strand:- start:86 stop:241 length:156 start_codon:yes stop_codon:yes gene_type:complete